MSAADTLHRFVRLELDDPRETPTTPPPTGGEERWRRFARLDLDDEPTGSTSRPLRLAGVRCGVRLIVPAPPGPGLDDLPRDPATLRAIAAKYREISALIMAEEVTP